MINLVLERTEGKYLKPGDLFTDKPPEYWYGVKQKMVSAPLFICLNQPDADDNELVYKITMPVEKLPEPQSETQDDSPMMDPFAPPGVSR